MQTEFINAVAWIPPFEEITVRMPTARAVLEGGPYGGPRKGVGVSEDYLLSKLPPDGKDVPFVLPTFKPSYVQPQGSRYPNYNEGPEGKYVFMVPSIISFTF